MTLFDPWTDPIDELAVKVHHDAHDTELSAAAKAFPRSGTARRRVYDHLARAGYHGATDDEIQAALNMPPNTERPRRVELVDAGLAYDSGHRRPSAHGNDAIVWRVAVVRLSAPAAESRPPAGATGRPLRRTP